MHGRTYKFHLTPPPVVRVRSLVRFPYVDFATYALVYGNIIRDCGFIDWVYGGHTGNGQGICEYRDYHALYTSTIGSTSSSRESSGSSSIRL